MDSDDSHAVSEPQAQASLGVVVVAAPAWFGVEAMVVAVALGAAVLFGIWSWRSRLRHSDAKPGRPSPPPLPADVGESVDRRAPVTFDSGLMHASAPEKSSSERAFFAVKDVAHPLHCPRCERRFPRAFATCPFDATRLRESSRKRSEPKKRNQLPRRYCRNCDRRFELTALYCYHDGEELHRDNSRLSEDAPTYRICRSCGWESDDEDTEQCPRDGGALTPLDPTERGSLSPTFPFNRCRRCGHVAEPHQTRCPTDGSLMLPELNIRLTALPPLGHGPRRKICPDCGTEFGDSCHYCSYDGASLIEIN